VEFAEQVRLSAGPASRASATSAVGSKKASRSLGGRPPRSMEDTRPPAGRIGRDSPHAPGCPRVEQQEAAVACHQRQATHTRRIGRQSFVPVRRWVSNWRSRARCGSTRIRRAPRIPSPEPEAIVTQSAQQTAGAQQGREGDHSPGSPLDSLLVQQRK